MPATLVPPAPSPPSAPPVTPVALALLRCGTPVPGSVLRSLVRRVARRLGALRATDAAAAPLDPPPGLAGALDAALRDDERRLLEWLGGRVPPAELAAWVGSSFGVARVRVLRLRERLRDVARRHAATLPPDERVALERWLHAPVPARQLSARPPAPTR